MSDSKHVSKDELLQMLDGSESSCVNRIGEHLHQCSSCREKLDALAAQPEMWDKAPSLLKSDVELQAGLRSGGIETTELPSKDADEDERQWDWPIASILDPPKHPEMLGRIGDYDIEREIGRGGMGIVLKAHESELNRPLAIKVLAPHLASHGTARQRFAQEARAAAGVIHPNVIAVYRVENSGKTPYIVMPFVAGPSMQTLVEENGPLAEEEIVRMALQISAGLTAAHSQGLVHRDIKPANILVSDGGNRVMITDFGLARAEDDASLTRTGWLTGTPNYMSPEQTRGERLDQRSDLFSLGSLIYFLATGRLPFRSESPLGVLRRIQEDDPTPVRQVNRNISKTLQDIVEVLLEKKSEDRFQSAAELHEVLTQHMYFLHQPDVSHPPVVKKQLDKPTASRKFVLGGLTAGAFGLLALAMFSFVDFSEPAKESDESVAQSTMAYAVGDEKAMKLLEPELMAGANVMNLRMNSKGKTPPVIISTINAVDGVVVQDEEDEKDRDIDESFNRGLKQLEEKDYAGAIKSFKVSAADKDLRAMSLYNLGCAYALLGENEKALYQLELAVTAGFDSYKKYKTDTDLDSLRDDDRFDELMADLKELEQSRELLWKALQRIDDEAYEEAVDMIHEVMEIDGDNEKAWLNLGYALHMQEQYDDAMKWHQKAANGKDYVALGHFNSACVYSIRGQKDNAFTSLDAALEHGIHNNLGLGHLKSDSDLDNIRDDSRFKVFIERFVAADNECDCEDCEEECSECEECEDCKDSDSKGVGTTSDEEGETDQSDDEGEDDSNSDEPEFEFTAVRQ